MNGLPRVRAFLAERQRRLHGHALNIRLSFDHMRSACQRVDLCQRLFASSNRLSYKDMM